MVPRGCTRSWPDGRRHGRKRVARIMRASGLRGRAAKRWRKTTIADPAAAARADRIRRDFTADAARVNSRWCGDITYISTKSEITDISLERFRMAYQLLFEDETGRMANRVLLPGG
jgi:transposase InsO family protein